MRFGVFLKREPAYRVCLSPRMGRSSVARGGSPETDDGTQQVAPDGAVEGTTELLRGTSMVKRPPSQ
mgnify:CR=1 FL=1